MKEKFLLWQGTKRRELFLSCCGFDSYISFVGKKLRLAFGTVYNRWLRGHTFFGNIFAKTKKFAKPFTSVHMGPRSNFLSKKMVKNLVTLSLLRFWLGMKETGLRKKEWCAFSTDCCVWPKKSIINWVYILFQFSINMLPLYTPCCPLNVKSVYSRYFEGRQ